MIRCERCQKETYYLEPCEFCGRKICRDCFKSSKRVGIRHVVICKDCWGDLKKRARYKAM